MSASLSAHTSKSCQSVTHTQAAWQSVTRILSVGLSLIRYLYCFNTHVLSLVLYYQSLCHAYYVSLCHSDTLLALKVSVKPAHRLTLLSFNFSRGALTPLIYHATPSRCSPLTLNFRPLNLTRHAISLSCTVTHTHAH